MAKRSTSAAPPDATEALLLALCRNDWPETARARLTSLLAAPVDWSRLAELAALHGVVGLVSKSLAAAGWQAHVPAPARAAMQAAVTQIRFDGMLHLHETGRMTAALAAVGIEPILLKGQALADLLYDDPLIRPASDVDLLVRWDEVERAEAALAGAGYEPQSAALRDYELGHNYHVTLWREVLPGRPLLLELHWDLGARNLFQYNLADWRARVQLFRLPDVATPLQRFAPGEQLLHLALHMRKHRYVGLRWLVDVATLLRRFENELDWPALLAAADTAGLRTLLYTTVLLAQRSLDVPVAQRWLDALAPSALRRSLLASVLQQDTLLAPLEVEDAGWTRLAPAEVLLLDQPGAMARELRWRLFPPVEKLGGLEAAGETGSQRAARYARRLLRRSRTLASKQ